MKKVGRPRGLVRMPSPSKKGLASKKYSRSLEATNILFAENKVFKKPKSKKNKIFNPNAKYYQGGGYVDIELDDAEIQKYVDGGYVVEEVNDPAIPQLSRFNPGGSPCPRGQMRDASGKCVNYNWGSGNIQAADSYAGMYGGYDSSGVKNLSQVQASAKKGKKFSDYILRGGKSRADVARNLGKNAGAYYGMPGEALEPVNYTKAGIDKFTTDVKNAKKNYEAKEKDYQNYLKSKEKASKGKMDTGKYAKQYDEKGWSQYDVNTKEGSGPDAEYSAKEARQNWGDPEEWKKFAGLVSNAATAIPLLGAAGAMGSASAAILENPYVQAGLTAYGVNEAVTNTLPEAYKDFSEGRYWEGLGNTAMAGLDLIPGIGLGSKGAKLGAKGINKLVNKPIISRNKRVLPEELELQSTVDDYSNNTIDLVDPKSKESFANIMYKQSGVDPEWAGVNIIGVKPDLRGNRVQDVLYEAAIKNAQANNLKGLRSGDMLLSPEETLKAHSRFNKVPLEKLPYAEHAVSGLTGHQNPNVIEDFFEYYKTIPKKQKVKYSTKDLFNQFKKHAAGGESDEPPGSKKKPYNNKNAILPRWMPKGMVKAIQNTEVGISPLMSNEQAYPMGMKKNFTDIATTGENLLGEGTKAIGVSNPAYGVNFTTGLTRDVSKNKGSGWALKGYLGKPYDSSLGKAAGAALERIGEDTYDARWNEYYEDLADYNAGTMAPSMLWNGDGKGWDPEKNKPKYDGKLTRGLGKAMQKSPLIGGLSAHYRYDKFKQPHGYKAAGEGEIKLDWDPSNNVGLGLKGGLEFSGGNRYSSKNYNPGGYKWNVNPSVTAGIGTRPHFGFNLNAGVEGLPGFMPKKFPGYFYGNVNYNQSLIGPGSFSANAGMKFPLNDLKKRRAQKRIDEKQREDVIKPNIVNPNNVRNTTFGSQKYGGVLERFTNGGGPGDDIVKTKNLQEVTIYDPKTRKEQLNLFEQLRVAKEAYQNYTKQNKGKKWTLNAADPLSSSISDLRKQIKLYKDEFKKEKEETERELKRLESLKNRSAFKNNKDIQNLTLKDLSTVKGKAKLLDAARSSNLSGDELSAIYKGWGLDQADYNVKSGKSDYSAKAAEAAWKPEVMQDVGKYAHAAAMGVVGLAGAGALGPALIGEAGSGTGAAAGTANLIRSGVSGAGHLLRNPWVQAGLTGNAAYQIGKDPRATIEGLATTGVEAYDLVKDPSKIPGAFTGEEKNRFGENYGSGVGDVLNVASLSIPGLSLLKKGRDFTKTSKGFELAANYWKPVKDTYKAGVKGFGRFVAPVTEANIPGYAAGVTDMVTGGRGATEFVNRAGLLLSNAPAWAKPTVSNALKGYTLFNAGDGIMNSTEGLSSGNKAQFNEGVKKVTNSTIDAAGVLTNFNHLYNLTTPLNVIARGEELRKDFKEGRFDANTAFSALRMVNSVKGMPFHRSQVLPLQDPAFKGATHLKFGRVRDFINKRNARMKLQKGGIITSASNREIEDLIKRGFIVEELD